MTFVGDVIYLKLFRTPAIILNSLESARELLDKRSAKYSDRTRAVLLAELFVFSSSSYVAPNSILNARP